MNTINKPLLVAGVVGTIGVGALVTGVTVSAESGAKAGEPMSSLVDKIASTFDLDKSKVQEVFDQQRTEIVQKREAKLNERLDALVSKGTITAKQKTAIQTKLKQMRENHHEKREELKKMTEEERKSSMDETRAELESWADEQGINLNELKGIFRGHGGPHRGTPPVE